jgi:hypothetical protein
MIDNECSIIFPPRSRESNPSHAKYGMVIDPHPVASAPIKGLMCFGLSPLGHRNSILSCGEMGFESTSNQI